MPEPVDITDKTNTNNKRDKATETPGRSTRRYPSRSRDRDGVQFSSEDTSMAGEESLKEPPSILKNKDPSTSSPQKKKPRGRRRSVSIARDATKDSRSASKTKHSSKTKRSSKSRSASKTKSSKDGSSNKRTPSKAKDTSKPRSSSKTATPKSYASAAGEKTTPSPLKSPTPKKLPKLKYSGFAQGSITVKTMDNLRQFVYSKYAILISTLQKVEGAKTTRLANLFNSSAAPITSANGIPKDHVEVEQYFYTPGEPKQWYGPSIRAGKTRKILFTFKLESDIEIDKLIRSVAVDMMDHHIQLEYKTCQAIDSENSLTFVRIYNKFSPSAFQKAVQSHLEDIQTREFNTDKDSFLGTLEAAGAKFPQLTIRKEFPFNGPYEKSQPGVDTRFKQTYVVEYNAAFKSQVEAAIKIYKRSGDLRRYWGEHANAHYAPPKSDETSESTLNTWHTILASHNATMLSMGMVKLEDIVNLDYEVDVEYWKTSKNSRPYRQSLRDVLHSVVVPGSGDIGVQVFHGICRCPDGGFEAAVASTVPLAQQTARNVASHPAGWVYGFLKQKKWKSECITKLLRKSFTTESVVAAQTSSWDKKTGKVSSVALSEEEQEMRRLEGSWIDLNLGSGAKVVEEGASLNTGDMAAFNFEDGASVNTMGAGSVTSGDNSDTDGSILYSSDSDDQSDESGSGESGDYESGSGEGSIMDEDSVNEDNEKQGEVEQVDDMEGVNSDLDSLSLPRWSDDESFHSATLDNDMEKTDDDKTADLVPLIRKLFPEDSALVDSYMGLASMGPIPSDILDTYDKYNSVLEFEERIYKQQAYLMEVIGEDNYDFDDRMERLESKFETIQEQKRHYYDLLKTALRSFVDAMEHSDLTDHETTNNGSTHTKNPDGEATRAEDGDVDESAAHANNDNSQETAGETQG